MDSSSRIRFEGNPWPAGHPIARFEWWGHLGADRRLRLHMQLESARYDAETEGDPGRDDDDWSSAGAWTNYHACTLRPNRGVVVGRKRAPFRYDGVFRADTRPPPSDERAFDVYLLGHDGVARHEITIARSRLGRRCDVRWNGRIALEYAGETRFVHRFEAVIVGVPRFSRVTIDPDVEPRWAETVLPDVLEDGRRFAIGAHDGIPVLRAQEE